MGEERYANGLRNAVVIVVVADKNVVDTSYVCVCAVKTWAEWALLLGS